MWETREAKSGWMFLFSGLPLSLWPVGCVSLRRMRTDDQGDYLLHGVQESPLPRFWDRSVNQTIGEMDAVCSRYFFQVAEKQRVNGGRSEHLEPMQPCKRKRKLIEVSHLGER